jgi:hypothetical protein
MLAVAAALGQTIETEDHDIVSGAVAVSMSGLAPNLI